MAILELWILLIPVPPELTARSRLQYGKCSQNTSPPQQWEQFAETWCYKYYLQQQQHDLRMIINIRPITFVYYMTEDEKCLALSVSTGQTRRQAMARTIHLLSTIATFSPGQISHWLCACLLACLIDWLDKVVHPCCSHWVSVKNYLFNWQWHLPSFSSWTTHQWYSLTCYFPLCHWPCLHNNHILPMV